VSAAIALPVDRPVQLVGVSLSASLEGVGQASILRSSGGFLRWVSFSYIQPAPAAASGSDVGTRIVYIGSTNNVIVETDGPSAIRVRNLSIFTATGSVSLMW
jgi:hypothetical protein